MIFPFKNSTFQSRPLNPAMFQFILRVKTMPLSIVMLSCLLSLNSHAQTLIPSPPQLAATSYLLIDANSGEVLIENNADERIPPASLTKMMTSYIVSSEINKGNVSSEDLVPISVKAWRMGGSKMFVREGTEVVLEDLLKGVIIQSGNDASVALAEYLAGDESAFAEVMNQQASLLGMHNTHFVNATGWPAENHFTTARDLSILAKALINDYPQHYALYSEREFTYGAPGEEPKKQPNRNNLLWRDKTVDGIKTGHTDAAGFCLVASAVKGNMRLISVVMGTKSSRSREQETQKLLSYGFRYYDTRGVYDAGEVLNSQRVWKGESETVDLSVEEALILTIPRGRQDDLTAKMKLEETIVAPIEAGEVLGTLEVSLDGKLLASRSLVAVSAVAEAGFISRLVDSGHMFFNELLGL